MALRKACAQTPSCDADVLHTLLLSTLPAAVATIASELQAPERVAAASSSNTRPLKRARASYGSKPAHTKAAGVHLFNEHYIVKTPGSHIEFRWHRVSKRRSSKLTSKPCSLTLGFLPCVNIM